MKINTVAESVEVFSIGELLVEVMRTEKDVPLCRPGMFAGVGVIHHSSFVRQGIRRPPKSSSTRVRRNRGYASTSRIHEESGGRSRSIFALTRLMV